MNQNQQWLPALVRLGDHEGSWHRYLDALYAFFTQDFIDDRPEFQGRRVGHKRHPLEQGKVVTFWHLISSGTTEANRQIDLRRCERIRWPRPMVENSQRPFVCCWRTRRKGESRIVIALDDFSYIVVLAERKDYLLLWTAYCVEREHRRRKLAREWEESRA